MALSRWTMTLVGAVFIGAAFLCSCSSGNKGAAQAGQSPAADGAKAKTKYKPGETVTFRISGPVCYKTGYHQTFVYEIVSEQGDSVMLDAPPSPYVSYEPPASFVKLVDQIETWDQKSWRHVVKKGLPEEEREEYESVQVPAGTYLIFVLEPSKEWAAKVPNPGDRIAITSTYDANCEKKMIETIVIE